MYPSQECAIVQAVVWQWFSPFSCKPGKAGCLSDCQGRRPGRRDSQSGMISPRFGKSLFLLKVRVHLCTCMHPQVCVGEIWRGGRGVGRTVPGLSAFLSFCGVCEPTSGQGYLPELLILFIYLCKNANLKSRNFFIPWGQEKQPSVRDLVMLLEDILGHAAKLKEENLAFCEVIKLNAFSFFNVASWLFWWLKHFLTGFALFHCGMGNYIPPHCFPEPFIITHCLWQGKKWMPPVLFQGAQNALGKSVNDSYSPWKNIKQFSQFFSLNSPVFNKLKDTLNWK